MGERHEYGYEHGLQENVGAMNIRQCIVSRTVPEKTHERGVGWCD